MPLALQPDDETEATLAAEPKEHTARLGSDIFRASAFILVHAAPSHETQNRASRNTADAVRYSHVPGIGWGTTRNRQASGVL